MNALLPNFLLPSALLLAAVAPGLAQDARPALPNRMQVAGDARPGPVASYVVAARLLPAALAQDDALSVLAAVRMARSVTLRPAMGWRADPEPPTAPAPGPGLPRDPGSDAALALLTLMTEGDVELQLTVDELLMQGGLPPGGGSVRAAGAAPGQTTRWSIPFYGAAPAEIGLVNLSDTAITLTVTDDKGAVVCPADLAQTAVLCAFTPARNGWFLVDVAAAGDGRAGDAAGGAGYLLLTN